MLSLAHVGGGPEGPLQLLGITALAVAYAIRVANLSRAGRPVPRWRIACFAAGGAVLGLAYASPVDHMAGELLTAHMAQHLLIVDGAAPLIVLGLTGPILQPLLAIRGLRWLRLLGHPVASFAAWVVLIYLWHAPSLYEASSFDSDALHAVQHASFFAAGLAAWMALLGPLPAPSWFGTAAKLIYVAAVRLAGAVLANVLMWSGTVLYPGYAEIAEREFSIGPLTDQANAGVVMMLESTVVTIAVFTWLLLLWAKQDTERQELLDLAAERGVELDPARAERAVSAGEVERLRRRIRDEA